MISASKSMIMRANDLTTDGVDIFKRFGKFAVLLLWADARRQVWYGMGAPFEWIMQDSQGLIIASSLAVAAGMYALAIITQSNAYWSKSG